MTHEKGEENAAGPRGWSTMGNTRIETPERQTARADSTVKHAVVMLLILNLEAIFLIDTCQSGCFTHGSVIQGPTAGFLDKFTVIATAVAPFGLS